MSIWKNKLQQFINEQIDKEIRNRSLSGENEKIVREYLQNLAEIKDANNTEPILKYLSKSITPREHLQDLLNQLKSEIYSLLRVVESKAAFNLLRSTFCYLDYIALLRFGPKNNNNYGKGAGNLEELLDDFGPEDMKERYRKYKDYLVQIYRHDLVHLISPRLKVMKVKENGGERIETIGFKIIADTCNDKGKEKKANILQDFEQACSLMRSVQFRKNTFFHLRFDQNIPTINSLSMFFDTANYIKDYQSSLTKEVELNKRFAEHFIAINLSSALKLLNRQTINLLENKQINTNEKQKPSKNKIL